MKVNLTDRQYKKIKEQGKSWCVDVLYNQKKIDTKYIKQFNLTID